MSHIFDVEALNKRIEELKAPPPFQPDKYEPRWSCTQLFETGIEVTIHFVVRNNEMVVYNSTQRKADLKTARFYSAYQP